MNRTAKYLQMVRFFWEYRRQREVLRSLPIRLWIESSSACNLRCVMCPNKDMAPGEKGLMGIDLFRKIIDEAREFANDVNLHHRGEPLLNPDLPNMIRYAKAAGLKVRFHSNGSLLTEAKALELLDAGPDLISFSVDGFTKESYEKIRAGATFEKTCGNIFRLAERRRQQNRKTPYIVVERIRLRDPATEPDRAAIEATRRRFFDAGVDEVIEKEEYVWAQTTAPEPAGAIRCAACTFPWYAIVICYDGTVTPCPQDFNAAMNMGNARMSSLKEIWNGEKYRNLRRGFVNNIASLALCHKCDRLRRKTIFGVPIQYMLIFLADHIVGYGPLRRWINTQEWN